MAPSTAKTTRNPPPLPASTKHLQKLKDKPQGPLLQILLHLMWNSGVRGIPDARKNEVTNWLRKQDIDWRLSVPVREWFKAKRTEHPGDGSDLPKDRAKDPVKKKEYYFQMPESPYYPEGSQPSSRNTSRSNSSDDTNDSSGSPQVSSPDTYLRQLRDHSLLQVVLEYIWKDRDYRGVPKEDTLKTWLEENKLPKECLSPIQNWFIAMLQKDKIVYPGKGAFDMPSVKDIEGKVLSVEDIEEEVEEEVVNYSDTLHGIPASRLFIEPASNPPSKPIASSMNTPSVARSSTFTSKVQSLYESPDEGEADS